MNSLNLRQVCGGDTIKQADFGSELAFELLDEQYVKFREPLGEAAKVILKKDNTAIYQKSVPITQNTVLFKFDKILPVGSYVLEIIVGDYVFPSNNRVIITVEQTYGDFEPEYLVKVSYEELKEDVDDLKSKVTALEERPIVDTALTERVEALERKEDKDTVYDDTDIKNRLVALEQKEDKDTVYDDSKLVERIENLETDDTSIKERISALEDKPDNDTIYDDSSLKSRIAELENMLESLNTVRRAPTGYTLDRTTIPWTVRFDNGCELRFPKNSPTSERDKANLIYGYGFPANNNSTVAFSAPIPPLIISASRGTFTVDKFKESDEAHFHVTYADYRLYYPIRKSDDFNWENAYGDRVNQTVSTNGKSNFTKLMYELGIWSEADVLYLGAVKK